MIGRTGHLEKTGRAEDGEVEGVMEEGEVVLEVAEGVSGVVGSGGVEEVDMGGDGEMSGCFI